MESIAGVAPRTEDHKPGHSSYGFNVKEEPKDDANLEGFDNSDMAKPKHFQLQTLLAGADPGTLEASVEKGVELLETLKTPMIEKAPHSPDAAQWLQQIGKYFMDKQSFNGRDQS